MQNQTKSQLIALSLLSLWLAGASWAQHTQAPRQTPPPQSSGSFLESVWGVVRELPGAIAETFISGEAWQSFAQMSVGAVRNGSFGLISPDPQSVSQGWEALGYKPVEPGVADISREVIGPKVGWGLRELVSIMLRRGRLPVKPSPPKPSPVKPSTPATRNTWGAAGGATGVRSLSGSGFIQNSAQGPLDTHAPVSGLRDATLILPEPFPRPGVHAMDHRGGAPIHTELVGLELHSGSAPYHVAGPNGERIYVRPNGRHPVITLPPGNAFRELELRMPIGLIERQVVIISDSLITIESDYAGGTFGPLLPASFYNRSAQGPLDTHAPVSGLREEMDAIRDCNLSTGGCGYPNPKEEVIGPVVGATLPPVGTAKPRTSVTAGNPSFEEALITWPAYPILECPSPSPFPFVISLSPCRRLSR